MSRIGYGSDAGQQALNATMPVNYTVSDAQDHFAIASQHEMSHRRGMTATMPYDLGLGIAGGSFEIQQ